MYPYCPLYVLHLFYDMSCVLKLSVHFSIAENFDPNRFVFAEYFLAYQSSIIMKNVDLDFISLWPIFISLLLTFSLIGKVFKILDLNQSTPIVFVVRPVGCIAQGITYSRVVSVVLLHKLTIYLSFNGSCVNIFVINDLSYVFIGHVGNNYSGFIIIYYFLGPIFLNYSQDCLFELIYRNKDLRYGWILKIGLDLSPLNTKALNCPIIRNNLLFQIQFIIKSVQLNFCVVVIVDCGS